MCVRKQRVAAAVSILFCLALPTAAQTATTSLRGNIVDPSGAVVSDATVVLSAPQIGINVTRQVNGRGEYSFSEVTPGKYQVVVSAPGFGETTRSVELLVNQPSTVSVTMRVAADVSITVDSTAAVLNTTDATIGNAFNTQQIQALPFEGNNINDLLSLQPGVLFTGDNNETSNTDTRPGTVDGARSDQNNLTLDGVDNNVPNESYAFTGVLRATRDSLQEFRVVTTNAGADAGRSSGAQVALVTRAGTNQFHGSAYYYYRPTNTVANDWFLKKSELASGRPNRPAKLLRNLFGASLGGPVLHDKLFFFGAYEGLKLAENTIVTNTVPTPSLTGGTVRYTNAAGGTTSLSRADLARIDPLCLGNGTCPLGPGANPAVLTYLAQFPVANSTTTGDGLNTAAYTFASPSPVSDVTSTVRFDVVLGAHRLFTRGNLQQDNSLSTLQFPGAPPNTQTFNNSRGVAAGDIWTLSPELVNNLRYGFTRYGSNTQGNISSPYVSFSQIVNLAATTTSQRYIVPEHNIVDDLTWTRGRHSLQFGGNYRLLMDSHANNGTVFNHAGVTTGNLVAGGIANTGSSLDAGAFGYPQVAPGFSASYNNAIADVTGLMTSATAYANYSIQNGSLTPLGNGQVPTRHFLSNEVEYYVQDAWRVTPKLTLTLGLRHSLLQAPYERGAQQIVPTTSLNQWFIHRVTAAAQGGVNQPPISFTQGGQAAGKSAYWQMDKLDVSPRFAFAWAPNESMSVRGGYGLYYDHFGDALIDALDQRGSFGLSSTLANGASQYVDTAPRFTSITGVPTSLLPTIPSSTSLPTTPPNALLTAWVLDDKIRTPYSHVMDFSVQQKMTKQIVFELDYVGRLGRRLLQQLDLAEPLNVVDPKSGTDYYTAATRFSREIDQGLTTVPTDAYWENMFPLAAAHGKSATQNIYTSRFLHNRGNETEGLFELDTGIAPGAAGGATYRYFNPQYVNLVGFTSIGTSSYHALQASLHFPSAHGVQFDANYTFSKSLDLGSDGERVASANSRGYSQILNSFQPRLNKSVSDFDVRHNFSLNALGILPVGRGQRVFGGAGRLVDAVVGGWTGTGLLHLTSGLPFAAYDGKGWTTNFDVRSYMVATGSIQSGGHRLDTHGNPNAFASPTSALAALRLPYPGEAGQRNFFRGDGYFSVDLGVHKAFQVVERQTFQVAAEAFNVSNSVRFDPKSISNNANSASSFGSYTTLLTQNRRLQFSARYSF